MALSLEQVRHVANLARLSLTADEEQRFQEQLSAMLDAVETLKAVDTTGVEPTSHANFGDAALREDVARPSLGVDKALQNAPAKSGTRFSVPRVIE